MARPIDEKIVAMKMDNSDFKRKAVETTSLFGKLTNSLNKIPGVNLGKTTQELGNISQQAGNAAAGVSGIGNAVQTISNRFTTMGVIATTALMNITNRAVNAGIQITKSLTLDQVTAGFSEYELKIGSIQTMLANTEWAGTSLEDVKGTLAELNTYADETIYSFGQMTQNIGRFTAAGVKLDDATVAIKGLSNLAAVSGSDVNQLNTAMYQMSQSMAAGYFNLMDWNSLVNAGMGGKKLQDELLKTAESMGVAVDMSEGFRLSISQGWLSSEIFLETMKKFGKDKSMTEAATSVRTLTSLMSSLKEGIGSGWATTWEHIFGDFNEATKFWTDLSETVNSFFDSSADARNKFMKGVAEGNGFQNIFEGIANAVKPVMQIFSALGEGFERVFPPASVEQVIEMTENFKDFTKGLALSGDTMDKLTTIFQGAFSIFSTVWEIAKLLGGALLNLIPEGSGGGILSFLEQIAEMAISFNKSVKEGNALTDAIGVLGDILGEIGRIVGETLGIVFDFSKSLKDNLGGAIDWIIEKLTIIGKYLKEAFGGFGGDEVVGTGMLVGIVMVLKKIFDFFQNAEGIMISVREVFGGVSEAIGNFGQSIQIASLLLIAISIGILAASLSAIQDLDSKDIAEGLTAIGTSLAMMIGSMAILTRYNIGSAVGVGLSLIALSIAVSIMASALKKIADLNSDEIRKGLMGLVGITATLAAAVIAMSKWGGKMKVGSLQLLALAGAVYIMADAVEKMSEIDAGKLFKSIGALALIFAQLAIFLKIVDRTKFGIGSAIGLIAVAGAIHIMVSAIKKISEVNKDELIKGLITIAAILAQIAIFSKLAGGPSMITAGIGMLIIAGAINALVGPIQTLGGMKWQELLQGLGGMAGALLILAGAAMLMQGSIGGAIAVTVMAVALNLLVIPVQKFANMTWGEMLKGFVGLAGGLALLAGAAMLLSPAIIPMLGFGAALLVMGVAMLAAGVGVSLFATGLGILATMTLASVASIVSSLALLIQGFTSLIPAAVRFVVELGVALLNGIAVLAPKLITTVINLIMDLLNAIRKNLPEFLSTGTDIIVQLINGIGNHVPKLVNAGMEAIVNLINGLADAVETNGPEITDAMLRLMGEVILVVIDAGVEMINALFGWMPGVKEATANIGSTAEKYIRDNFNADDAGNDKGRDFSGALKGTRGSAKSAADAIASAAEGGLDINVSGAGRNFGGGFVSGLWDKLPSVREAAGALAGAAKNTLENLLEIFSPSRVARRDGGHFGQGLALGISDKTKAVGEKAKDLALTAKDSLNQFLDGFQLPEDDNELHFKAVVDYETLDVNKFGQLKPVPVRPDTSVTSGLVSATRADFRQNGNNLPEKKVDQSTTNNNQYEIHVSANGTMSKSAVRKLAEDIQDEIKNLNDRDKINRGEEVAF